MKKTKKKYEGATLEEWKIWLEGELSPPYEGLSTKPQVRHIMKAFLALVCDDLHVKFKKIPSKQPKYVDHLSESWLPLPANWPGKK